VHRATGPTVLAFRDRADPRIGRGDSFVADQGEWTIVRVDGP
jgi:hypothetical protein